jgi:GNAT superfamily N-acetyltransferase
LLVTEAPTYPDLKALLGEGTRTIFIPASTVAMPGAPISTSKALSLLIREPESEADLVALHLLMLMRGEEFARVPINPVKVMERLVTAREQSENNRVLMAVHNCHLVGYLCIERAEHWYSDAPFLTDWGFYVLPQHRNGNVGPALLQEARLIAEQKGLPLFITINNPSRRRGGRTSMERAAALISFVPAGAALAFGKE